MRRIFLLFSLILAPYFFSQEVVFSKLMRLGPGILFYPLTDSQGVKLFIYDHYRMNCLSLKENMSAGDIFQFEKKNVKFDRLLGHSIDSSGITLFYLNNAKVFCETVDLNKKEVKQEPSYIKLKNEVYLSSFGNKDQFYVLTCKLFSTVLNLHIFKGNQFEKTKSFDFGEVGFTMDSSQSLKTLLYEQTGQMSGGVYVYNIDPKYPCSVDLVAKKNKVYFNDEVITMTVDREAGVTKIFQIDLKSMSHFYREIMPKGYVNKGDYFFKSNSFFDGKRLYQINGEKDEITISTALLQEDSSVNIAHLLYEKKIDFTQKPKVFSESEFQNFISSEVRKEDKNNVMQRVKIYNLGLNVYQSPNQKNFTIGGICFDEQYLVGGLPVSSATANYYQFTEDIVGPCSNSLCNAVQFQYETYYKSKQTKYTFSYEGENDSIMSNKTLPNIFDRFTDFVKSKNTSPSLKLCFNKGLNYFFGYYNEDEGMYYIRKF